MTGLTHLSHKELRRVWVIYAVLAALLLAVPAIAVQRRSNATHPIEHEVQRGLAAHGR
ncbi:MAG: hypothetical protein SFX73_00135 [Kofleriaceae bacterium]|nr:hypothetical protein [Kofleriaceae bacterium]